MLPRRATGPTVRPWSVILALSLATASSHAGARRLAPPPDLAGLEEKAASLKQSHDYRALAELLDDALSQLPESYDTRVRRNAWASMAANAYRLASEGSPDRCSLLNAGFTLTTRYLADLLAVYGAAAKQSDEYLGMVDVEALLTELHHEHDCTLLAAPQQAAPEPTPPPEEPSSRATSSPAVPPPSFSRRTRDLRISLVVTTSGALALLGASLGTGLSRYHSEDGTFVGASYLAIVNAARDTYLDGTPGNEVNYDNNTDICARARAIGSLHVLDACNGWTRLGKVAVATGVLAAVFGAATVGLGAALARSKSRDRALRAAARPRISALPGPDGLRLELLVRF